MSAGCARRAAERVPGEAASPRSPRPLCRAASAAASARRPGPAPLDRPGRQRLLEREDRVEHRLVAAGACRVADRARAPLPRRRRRPGGVTDSRSPSACPSSTRAAPHSAPEVPPACPDHASSGALERARDAVPSPVASARATARVESARHADAVIAVPGDGIELAEDLDLRSPPRRAHGASASRATSAACRRGAAAGGSPQRAGDVMRSALFRSIAGSQARRGGAAADQPLRTRAPTRCASTAPRARRRATERSRRPGHVEAGDELAARAARRSRDRRPEVRRRRSG